MEVDIGRVLKELSLGGLKKACEIKNIEIRSRKKEDYIVELSALEWSDSEFKKLTGVFKEDRENSVKVVLSYLFRSSDIINLSPKTIESKLKKCEADLSQEIINGFKVIEPGERLINSEYWYTRQELILDDMGKIHYYPVPTRIRFEIKPLDGIVMIYTISPGNALKCKNALEEVLTIETIPISPLEAE